MPARPAAPDPRPSQADGTGPFVAIGLADDIALRLAGTRALLRLDAGRIAADTVAALHDPVLACSLLDPDMDALEVIAALVAAGYRGVLRVVAPPLPNPKMVERELARAASGMTVTLVIL